MNLFDLGITASTAGVEWPVMELFFLGLAIQGVTCLCNDGAVLSHKRRCPAL